MNKDYEKYKGEYEEKDEEEDEEDENKVNGKGVHLEEWSLRYPRSSLTPPFRPSFRGSFRSLIQ